MFVRAAAADVFEDHQKRDASCLELVKSLFASTSSQNCVVYASSSEIIEEMLKW